MPLALNLLRSAPHYRRASFERGLAAAGWRSVPLLPDPGPGDLLLIWNRYGGYDEIASSFERAGATVLVAENCPFGNDFRGGSYSLARGHVAMTGGAIADGGSQRWDSWGVPLEPWRAAGRETVILGQRSIGHASVRCPVDWAEGVRARSGWRIRQHPAVDGAAPPLAQDLSDASEVVTWSSAAAVQALLLGVPVWHAHPRFIGTPAARPLGEWGAEEARRDDGARLAVLRRLAWATWSLDEISSGEAIRWACA